MASLNLRSIVAGCATVAAFFGARDLGAQCTLAERRAALLTRAVIGESDGDFLTTVPRLFARDGIYLTPGLLTSRGPDGALAWLGRDTLNKTSWARMVTVGGDVSSSGDEGFTYGYLDAVRADGDLAPASYHAYWRRDAGGEWGIVALVRRRRTDGPVSSVHTANTAGDRRCVTPRANVDTVAIAREIATADQAFSDAGAINVADAFATYATDDVAKAGSEAAYVYGREAVRGLFTPPPPKGLNWQPELASAARSGDFGFSIGVAGPRDGTPLATGAAATGHYFTIWRRDADGKWRYVID